MADTLQEQLEKVNERISDRSSDGLSEYEIAGRKFKNISISDLIILKQNIERQINEKENIDRLNSGQGNPNKILTRFSR